MSNTVTSTKDGETHKQKMLALLHEVDSFHDANATKIFHSKEVKLMHRNFQIAIWWAIQQLDDEMVTIRVKEIKNDQ